LIALARHGQTDYNRTRRFQGHLPVALNETGRDQAQELANLCAEREWASLWASPLTRAAQTAQAVGRATGLTPQFDPRLAETDCGDWTDRPFDEVAAEDPDGFAAFRRADRDFRFPGGESFAEQYERVAAAIADIRTAKLPALVICHRGVIRLALVAATGDESQREADVHNGSLVELP
jgi:broad specificity phosphatase PhoE